MPDTNTKTAQERRRARRKEVRLIKADILQDIDKVEPRLNAAERGKNPELVKAYQNLFDILYAAYIDVVNSEV